MFKMRIDNVFFNIGFIIFLSACAVFDIRKKEIPISLILAGLTVALGINIWQIFEKTIFIADIGFSLLPGLFFLLISFCTKEKIGYGDGLILIVSGLAIGFYQCFLGLCISLICSSVFAIFLLILRKVEKNSGLAFVPFLTIGMGVSFFV